MLGVAIDAGAVAGHPVALVGPLVAGVADHGAWLHALEVALSVGARSGIARSACRRWPTVRGLRAASRWRSSVARCLPLLCQN